MLLDFGADRLLEEGSDPFRARPVVNLAFLRLARLGEDLRTRCGTRLSTVAFGELTLLALRSRFCVLRRLSVGMILEQDLLLLVVLRVGMVHPLDVQRERPAALANFATPSLVLIKSGNGVWLIIYYIMTVFLDIQ